MSIAERAVITSVEITLTAQTGYPVRLLDRTNITQNLSVTIDNMNNLTTTATLLYSTTYTDFSRWPRRAGLQLTASSNLNICWGNLYNVPCINDLHLFSVDLGQETERCQCPDAPLNMDREMNQSSFFTRYACKKGFDQKAYTRLPMNSFPYLGDWTLNIFQPYRDLCIAKTCKPLFNTNHFYSGEIYYTTDILANGNYSIDTIAYCKQYKSSTDPHLVCLDTGHWSDGVLDCNSAPNLTLIYLYYVCGAIAITLIVIIITVMINRCCNYGQRSDLRILVNDESTLLTDEASYRENGRRRGQINDRRGSTASQNCEGNGSDYITIIGSDHGYDNIMGTESIRSEHRTMGRLLSVSRTNPSYHGMT